MLRLPPFELHQPATVAEAVRDLSSHAPNVRLIGGGTDLLPNLKLRMVHAEHLVSVRFVDEMRGVTCCGESVRIGAATTLQDLAEDAEIGALLPALAYAASRVASPQIRRMATLAGNLNLDTRCRYINQSELWREALGGCLKSHGSECHVVPGGQGCVAALSADTVPPLIVYGARAHIAHAGGVREVAVADLYHQDGLHHVRIGRDELLVAVTVPVPGPHSRAVYRKWAVRRSIDFPLVSVALRLDLPDGRLAGGMLAAGVLGPRPRVLPLTALAGRALDESLAQTLGQMAYERCRPLPNVPYDAEYRRERLAVEVRRAVRTLAGLPERVSQHQ